MGEDRVPPSPGKFVHDYIQGCILISHSCIGRLGHENLTNPFALSESYLAYLSRPAGADTIFSRTPQNDSTAIMRQAGQAGIAAGAQIVSHMGRLERNTLKPA